MQIKDIIYKTLEENNSQWTPKAHNPSSAMFQLSNGEFLGPDILGVYYKWMGIKPSNTSTGQELLNMEMGNATHESIAKILSKANVKAQTEVKGKTIIPGLKYPISYRTDNHVEINGELLVIEIKSTTDSQIFGSSYFKGLVDKGPKQNHLLQTICYLNLVPGVKKAIILYVARDRGSMCEFSVVKGTGDTYTVEGNFTELNWRGIIEQWKLLETYLEKKEAPLPRYKVWVNPDGKYMKYKTIKGAKYQSSWEAEYSPYLDMIYLDPKNYELATYNADFKRRGLI